MTEKPGNIIDCGLDVGSMTVKCILFNEENRVLWKEYRRHNGHQKDCVRDFLFHINEEFPEAKLRIAITGSGSRTLKEALDAQFIQEVNALTLAVETYIPGANSVIELGGQDAKVILWKGDKNNRHTITYMNDKCAGGTGSTIDKIMSKIGISQEDAAKITLKKKQIHHIAAKCGVFAETDVVGLLKAGVSREEIFVSLCSAIVKQNIEVLVHGNVLADKVLLLGGPNTYIPVLRDLWREQIAETWKIHGFSPSESGMREAVFLPDDSQYFAAIGAVLFARENHSLHISKVKTNWFEKTTGGRFLRQSSARGRQSSEVNKGLVENREELEEFKRQYSVPEPENRIIKNEKVEAFIGIDGGSTSTKIAITGNNGELIYSDYVLSNGNPLEDVKILFQKINNWLSGNNAELIINGAAVTGYASRIIKTALNCDISLVETIAHYRAAVELYGDVDVICDVGGQDIKVLFIKNKRVADFRLNTQCSAGNGYFLHAMANQFDVPLEKYAEYAFRAKAAPKFNYGCAVFMEQDRVNFQQADWKKEEMMCALAQVLPLNIWNFVVQESNLAKFGRKYVLQGGTQKNLAAVKAQVDFIKRKVDDAEIFVHRYAGIAGAAGAALEAGKNVTGKSSFIGIKEAANISFNTWNDETTICKKCNVRCKRTFIDIENGNEKTRFISGNGCDNGSSEDSGVVKDKQRKLKEIYAENPDITAIAAVAAFSHYEFEKLPEHGSITDRNKFYPELSQRIVPKNEWKIPFQRSGVIRDGVIHDGKDRTGFTIAIPKLLNMYYFAPLFTAYFETLGIKVVFSDFTDQKLWENGNKWGTIDPCFPAKAAPAHIWQLLNMSGVNAIFFPIITNLVSDVQCTLGNAACVIQMGTPEVVEAVFTKERNLFKEKNIEYFDPSLNMDRYVEACDKMHEYFAEKLHITRDENAWAFNNGVNALEKYLSKQREIFADTMNKLIEEDRVGVLLIGHPYHHDFGLNHKIPEEFRKCGYPVFTIESIPTDREFLSQLFENDSESKNITDVWFRNFNRNTNQKIWAAKIAARHPNLAVVDLSSFKCGHDAPTYNYVDQILDFSGTPHFIFHDIDQNKPSSTFKIRIETADYFLKEYEKTVLRGGK
ncbi:MAG: acyl-CoA dehydratase activase-related protein [Treponema sp.]|jgi:predicted CoA-substrate-specific enzyme activase|nr:acyl-CoA dehydratase activase-related protein [Treponema sp.]